MVGPIGTPLETVVLPSFDMRPAPAPVPAPDSGVEPSFAAVLGALTARAGVAKVTAAVPDMSSCAAPARQPAARPSPELPVSTVAARPTVADAAWATDVRLPVAMDLSPAPNRQPSPAPRRLPDIPTSTLMAQSIEQTVIGQVDAPLPGVENRSAEPRQTVRPDSMPCDHPAVGEGPATMRNRALVFNELGMFGNAVTRRDPTGASPVDAYASRIFPPAGMPIATIRHTVESMPQTSGTGVPNFGMVTNAMPRARVRLLTAAAVPIPMPAPLAANTPPAPAGNGSRQTEAVTDALSSRSPVRRPPPERPTLEVTVAITENGAVQVVAATDQQARLDKARLRDRVSASLSQRGMAIAGVTIGGIPLIGSIERGGRDAG